MKHSTRELWLVKLPTIMSFFIIAIVSVYILMPLYDLALDTAYLFTAELITILILRIIFVGCLADVLYCCGDIMAKMTCSIYYKYDKFGIIGGVSQTVTSLGNVISYSLRIGFSILIMLIVTRYEKSIVNVVNTVTPFIKFAYDILSEKVRGIAP